MSQKRPQGRPSELSPDGARKETYYEIKRLWDDERGVSYIARKTGVSRQAIYKLIKREQWQ